MPSPVLLVTRPRPAAEAFARKVADALGRPMDAVIAPLMEIVPQGPLPRPERGERLIFTSANGVAAWVAGGGAGGHPADVVGRTTAEAARRAGLRPEVVARDAEDLLARLLASPAPGRWLHLRGEAARGDIAARLRAAGHEAREAVIYGQRLLPLSREAAALAQGDRAIVVPLFSPRSAAHFVAVWPGGRAPLLGVAMSPTVAEAARGIDWQELAVARAPDGEAMLATTLRLLDAGKRLEGAAPKA